MSCGRSTDNQVGSNGRLLQSLACNVGLESGPVTSGTTFRAKLNVLGGTYPFKVVDVDRSAMLSPNGSIAVYLRTEKEYENGTSTFALERRYDYVLSALYNDPLNLDKLRAQPRRIIEKITIKDSSGEVANCDLVAPLVPEQMGID